MAAWLSSSTEYLEARLAQLQERAPHTWQLIVADAQLQQQCRLVVLGSDFVQRALIQDDQLLATLMGEGRLQRATSLAEYHELLEAIAARSAMDEAQYGDALRQLRRREMVRIAWRDISGLAALHATLRETSWLAEAVIASATRFSAACLVQRHGALPAQDSGLVVLGMGKLGGSELNFSSDVDLVFLFPEGGTTQVEPNQGAAPLELEEFYIRQGRMLIRLLDAVTDVGFVFRVDMRLRPFGDSGPLVASFAFFEDYLQSHGRDWERYAYIKARAVSGAEVFAAQRESVLRPFVYRRYLDFGVFDALREMKGLISRDVARREMADNIKLGPGGIREVEFIVQAFQLVRGGQDGALREPSLIDVLPRLSGAKLLPAESVAELGAAYDFLRLLENRTQMLGDEQTHSLPADALSRERIAVAMGFEDESALLQAFAQHRAVVSGHFAALFADSETTGKQGRKLDLAPLWETGLGEAGQDEGVMRQQLDALCDDPSGMIGQLVELRDSGRMRRMDEPGRRRLKLLLELLIAEHGVGRKPDAWRRLLTVIEAIGQRSAYFSLLVENRKARERWVAICNEGDFLAAQLARNPALLDELIDERWVDTLPSRAELEEELSHRLSDVAPDDMEREVEALCRFKQAAVFRVALADLSGRLPLMSVSDRLTEIAELIVERTLELAWRQMVAQLGTPTCTENGGKPRKVRVAALGYGKLGGFELGYASDLDLVFLHDSTGDAQETDRATAVDNQVFFLRFAQRLIHLLTMHSGAGRLYEVDVRLRPSGKGGLLVTSIEAFRRYQFEEAWTWEHQALLHARAVAGNAGLMVRIESVRIDVLRNAVRRDDLREKVAEMRERMRRELSSAQPGEFDLKQDRGGIADIEFLAQYWALRWAREFPPLVHFSDTIRQLESVASAALVPQEQVDQLVRAYQVYRALSHRRSLEGQSGAVPAGDLAVQREAVTAIWSAWMS
jgi:glutamate-ammonia-ligase adenylyltransferase